MSWGHVEKCLFLFQKAHNGNDSRQLYLSDRTTRSAVFQGINIKLKALYQSYVFVSYRIGSAIDAVRKPTH